MYGGSCKLGCGGGGSGHRRSSFPPRPPPHRPSTASRLSLGSSSSSDPWNNRPGPLHAKSSSSAAAAVEESFSLVPGNNPLAFAMVIRLAPDLADEIRRVEAQGGTARIKFDSMANNPTGSLVIDVGGKEFRFTWARERGDLCDIYEERQGGVDGNGLLVESGCAWRKVNVQHILDESTKKRIKEHSEVAERDLKKCKAIDQGNPAPKSQIKRSAAVESNQWRNFNQKKEPALKTWEAELQQAGSVPKSTFKTGLASTASAKSKHSSSPLSSPANQSVASLSPFGIANTDMNHVITEDSTPTQMKGKENVASSENEIPTKVTSVVQEIPACEGIIGSKSMDLQSMLINLLIQNPKGMSLKALEKAVGDTIPNSIKMIETVIERIANFQAPGRYFLKPGVASEKFKKPSSASGSSPEDNHQQMHATEDSHDQRPVPEPRFIEKSPAVRLKEMVQSNSEVQKETNAFERVDVDQLPPDLLGEKKISENREGQVGSSSDSGSDSDSDSSDSGSDSGSCRRSRSRSGSPVGSGSGSIGDSESYSSSNSKEGSDENVDIMTIDDDKETQHKLQASETALSASPDPWRSVQDRADEKQDGDGSDAVDINGPGSAEVDIGGHDSDAIHSEKGFADDEKDIEMTADDGLLSEEGEKPVEGGKSFYPDHDMIQECQNFIGSSFDDHDNMDRDSFRRKQSDSSARISKGKSKRVRMDVESFDRRSERAKRLKDESLSVPISGGRDSQSLESARYTHNEDMYKGPGTNVTDGPKKDANADFGSQKQNNQAFSGKSSSDFQQSGWRSSDQSAWLKAPEAELRSKHRDSSGNGRQFSEKGSQMHEGFPIQREKASRYIQKEDNFLMDKKVPRNSKEGGAGGRRSASFDSCCRKQGEAFGKPKDAVQASNSHVGLSPKHNNSVGIEKNPSVSGRGLQRELSGLELGELREPLPEETLVKKQFERKSSFKQSENKSSTSDNCNSDLNKGKLVGKAVLDSGKPSPCLSAGVKRTPECCVEDLTRTHNKPLQSQSKHIPRVDNANVGSVFSKLADTSRLRQAETGGRLGNSMQGYGESQKKAVINAQELPESKRGPFSHTTKESKTQAPNSMTDLVNGQKDAILAEGNHNVHMRRESCLEEDSSSYSKYEKHVPKLRGPIKHFSQYKEYVQVYRDKYDSYYSLNKILEGYRNQFHKLEKDLQSAKGRDLDRYQKIMEQLKESYGKCGKNELQKHERLKKIFVVLHKELEHLKLRIKDFVHSYSKD